MYRYRWMLDVPIFNDGRVLYNPGVSKIKNQCNWNWKENGKRRVDQKTAGLRRRSLNSICPDLTQVASRHRKPLIIRQENSSFEREEYNFPVTSTTTSIASATRQKLLTLCEVNCSASPLKISTRFTSIHLYTFGE